MNTCMCFPRNNQTSWLILMDYCRAKLELRLEVRAISSTNHGHVQLSYGFAFGYDPARTCLFSMTRG